MSVFLKTCVCALVLFSSNAFAENEAKKDIIIDLSQNLIPDSPCSEQDKPSRISNYDNENYKFLSPEFYSHMISTPSFATTCISAPSFLEGRWKSLNSIELEKLVNVKCYNIVLKDVDGGFNITKDDVINFEKKNNCKIEPDSVVIFYTGWSHNWPNANYIDKIPTIDKEAVTFLCEERKIAGIAIDGPSIDTKDTKFEAQKILFKNDKFLIRNISKEAESIPATNAYLIIAPLKYESGNEAPARIFAVVKPKKQESGISKILNFFK